MAKGKQEREVKQPAGEIEEEITPPGATQDEVEELKAQLAEARAEAERWQKTHQSWQRDVVPRKDQRIQELEAKLAQPSLGDDALLEVMLQDRKSKAAEFGETDPTIVRLEAELTERKRRQATQAQLQYQEKVTQQYREKFDQQINNAGLDPADERLDAYYDAFEDAQDNGQFGRAERKLNRILAKVGTKKPTKAETEEEHIERLAEEKLRAKMDELGMLTSETGMPSALGKRTFTEEQIADRKFYEEHRDKILEAYARGEIKR